MKVNWRVYVTDEGEEVDRTWASVRDGSIPVTALDDDEVAAGCLRDSYGTVNARRRVPLDLEATVQREHLRRSEDTLRVALDPSLKVILDVSSGAVTNASAADRLRAAIYLAERTIGKVPERVEMTATIRPWEGLVESILVDAQINLEAPEVVEAGNVPPELGPGA